jgi:hypothetical protein
MWRRGHLEWQHLRTKFHENPLIGSKFVSGGNRQTDTHRQKGWWLISSLSFFESRLKIWPKYTESRRKICNCIGYVVENVKMMCASLIGKEAGVACCEVGYYRMWLTLVLRTLEVSVWDRLIWVFFLFFSDNPDKCQDSTVPQIWSRLLSYMFFQIYNSPIFRSFHAYIII